MEPAQLVKAFAATVQASLHGLQTLEPIDLRDVLAGIPAPRAEYVSVMRVTRLVFSTRRIRRIGPVLAGVIEDDIEDHAHAAPVRLTDQRHEIVSCADPWIHVQKILDAIAVEAVEVTALLEYRA